MRIDVHPGHWRATAYIQDIGGHQLTSSTSVSVKIHPGHQGASTYVQDIGLSFKLN